MQTEEAIRGRRSYSRLIGEISDDEIRALVAMGTLAPNHHLTEPWRFTVIRGAARERVGRAWAEMMAADSALTGNELEAFKAAEAKKLLRAPVVLVASCLSTPDDSIRFQEDLAATAAAVENILLAAYARGLGSRWRTGQMAYHPGFRQILGLDPEETIVGIIYLGHPDSDTPKPAVVARRQDVVRWIKHDSES